MKHMGMWWIAITKRLIRGPFFWICLSLFIVLPVTLWEELSKQGIGVRVLLLNEARDEAEAEALMEDLIASSSSVITFETCDDEAWMRDRITRGYAQAGYILPKGITDRMRAYPDSGEPVLTAIRSDREVSVRVIDEIVYGCIFNRIAEPVARDYAQSLTGKENVERDRFIKERYDGYLDAEVPFSFQHADGSEFTEFESDVKETKASVTFPVQGLMGVLIALMSLGGGVYWYRDDKRRVFLHLTRCGRETVHLFYILISTLTAAMAGLIVIFILCDGPFFREILRMLCYVGMLVPVVYLIQRLVRSARVYMALIPVFTICNLIGGSVFAELNDIPALTWLQKLIPLYYYNRM